MLKPYKTGGYIIRSLTLLHWVDNFLNTNYSPKNSYINSSEKGTSTMTKRLKHNTDGKYDWEIRGSNCNPYWKVNNFSTATCKLTDLKAGFQMQLKTDSLDEIDRAKFRDSCESTYNFLANQKVQRTIYKYWYNQVKFW